MIVRWIATDISDKICAGFRGNVNLLPFVINRADSPLDLADFLQILHRRGAAPFSQDLYRRFLHENDPGVSLFADGAQTRCSAVETRCRQGDNEMGILRRRDRHRTRIGAVIR